MIYSASKFLLHWCSEALPSNKKKLTLQQKQQTRLVPADTTLRGGKSYLKSSNTHTSEGPSVSVSTKVAPASLWMSESDSLSFAVSPGKPETQNAIMVSNETKDNHKWL